MKIKGDMGTAATVKYGTMRPVSGEVSEVCLTYRNKVEQSRRRTISHAGDIAQLVRGLNEMDANVGYRELMYAVYLDSVHSVLAVMKVSEGGLAETLCDVRMLLQAALLLSATSFAIVHNHPSGNVVPSTEDRDLADKVRRAAALLDLRLLDSIIIGDDCRNYCSFRDEGLM